MKKNDSMKCKESAPRDHMTTSKMEKLFYGFGDAGNNIILMFVSSFLTLYYTDSVGISAAFIGTMMLVTRILDGASDILMGVIIDKTNTRWGKARPWILYMAIPFAISAILVFHVPTDMSGLAKKLYIYLTYILLTVVCNTAVNLAYLALLPRFSLTSNDRSSATVVRSLFAMFASLCVAMLTPVFLGRLGGINNQHAWSTLSVIYASLSGVFLLLTFFGVKEKILVTSEPNNQEYKESLMTTFKILLSNKYFYITILLFITFYITNGNSGIGIYYARDVLGNSEIYGFQALLSVLPMLIGMPFMPLLFKKFGKRNIIMTGLAISALACFAGLLNPRSIPLYLSVIIIRGLGTAALSTAIFTLAGDIVDYNEWKTGIRAEGIVTSANSFGMKLGIGLGGALLGWILAWGHYNPDLMIQTSQTVNSMVMLAFGIPMIAYIICIFMLFFWDLEKYQPEVIKYIALKYNAYKTDK